MSAGCIGSPCAFGCTPNGANGFICGCPTGYQRIGQVRHRCYAGILRRYFYLFSFDFQWLGSLFVHDQSTIARTLWRRHQQCTDVRDKSRSVSYTACGWQDNIDGRLLFLQGDLTIIPDHRVVRRWSQQRKKNYFLFQRLTGKEDTEGICERNQWTKNWSHGGTKLWRDDSSDQQRGTIMGKSISSRSVFDRPGIEWESSNYNRLSRFTSLYINFFFSFFARSECFFNFKNWKQG